MSKHVVLKTIFVSVLGITFGYGLTRLSNFNLEHPSRQTASIPLTKPGVEQISYDYIDLKMDNVSIADKKDDTSIVQIKVTALKDLPEMLSYTWILGKDVISVDSLNGDIEPLHQGESKILELRVQNYSKEWQSHISINLTGRLGDQAFRRDVIISSRPEDSFEYVVQQAALAEVEMQKNLPSGKIKTFNKEKSLSEKFRKDKIIR